MNTLENSCFQFKENDEASKECIRIMKLETKSERPVKDNDYCWLSGINTLQISKRNLYFLKVVSPSDYLALLTGKQLTEGDLIVGNRFECIEDIINGREGVSFTKGEKYKCELDKSITNNFGYPQYTFKDSEYLNRHFKLLPTQESVKERNGDPSMDEMIQLVEQLESDKFHLQNQLKEAKEKATYFETMYNNLKKRTNS